MTDRFDDEPTDPNLGLDPDQRQQLHGDVTGDDLVAAVYADPDNDEPRLVYGDYLIERDDPRGEFVQLQLARGTGEPTDRERELLAQHLEQWTAPLYPVLVPESVGFERGFLARCSVNDRELAYRDVIGHPMWLTVEELVSNEIRLVTNPCLRSLRTLHTEAATLAALADVAHPVPVTRVRIRGYGRLGSTIERHVSAWRRVSEMGALLELRSLDVGALDPPVARAFLASALGCRLVAFEVMLDRQSFVPWDRILREHPALQRLVFRPGEAYADTPQSTAAITLERDDRGDVRALVEIDDAHSIGLLLSPLRSLPPTCTVEVAALDRSRPLSERRFEELVLALSPRPLVRRPAG